jgi:phage protein D
MSETAPPVQSKQAGIGGTENVTARYKVEIDGKEVTQGSTQGLESLTIEDHVDMIGVAEFTFSASGGGLPVDSFKAGQEIKAKVGSGPNGGGAREYAFVGIITGIRHSYIQSRETVTVLAMDPLCKLAASRVTKVYEEMKDSDIVEAVLGEAGLEAGNIEATTEEHPYTLQRNESHFSFLRRLAARNGYLLQSNDGKIDFAKAQFGGNAVTFDRGQLVSLDYSMTDRNIPTKVTAYGWDYLTKQRVEGSASSGDIETVGAGGNAVERTGQVWQQESYLSDVLVTTQSGAKELATSHLKQLAMGFLRGRAIIQGSAAVHAGSLVKFTGPMSNFQPEGYVLSARTRVYVGSGETTEVVFCANTHPDGG